MNDLSDIFGNSDKGEEGRRQLLLLLSKHLQGGGFQLVSNNGSPVSSGRELNLSEEILNGLVERCRKENSPVHIDSSDGYLVHAVYVGELDAVLIFVLPGNGPASGPESYGPAAVRLCIELSLMQNKINEDQKLLSIQHKQAKRMASALDERHRKNLNDLVRATERAEAANIAKREFLANISHEMRTPLNGIIGMADMAMATELDDDQKELLDTIDNEAKALHNLINDVLDFSKIEAGKIELEEIPFNLRHMINDMTNTLAYMADRKGLELCTFLSPDVPPLLIGDPGRLRQIIRNLAGNAMKFTSSGEIYIGAEMAEDLGDSLMLKFTVKDTGIGIPEAMQEEIFNPFVQADGSTTRKFGGTGLGTTISRQLTEIMGGEIGVESEEGKGSTFWFTALFGKQKEFVVPLSGKEHDLSELKVVVVSANRNNRFVLSEYLRSWGCLPVEADEGKKALAVLSESFSAKECCDLVVTGIELPDMNGFDMAGEIRKDKNLKDIPIIVLTSLGWRGDGKRCKDIGINGYLTKPVKQEDLFKVIASVMGCSGNEKEEETREVVTRHTIAEADTKNIHILVVEDHPTNQKVMKRYLGRAGYRVDIADNGLEGVKAFKQKQYNLILMDMQMPVMDGYKATVEIRKIESLHGDPKSSSRIPIIAVTAHVAKGDRERCLDAGADDYMTKPLSRELLMDLVIKWAVLEPEMPAGTTVPQEQEQVLVHANGDVPMNYAYALDQYEGDKDFLVEILIEFLEKTGSQINDMRQAVSDGNPEVVRREAHSIKGGAAILTAQDLSDAGYELQKIGESGSLEGSAGAIDRLEQEFHRLEAYAKSI
jgi:signal transduction histidine kinase/CheY-like chemotaxis protein